MLAHDFKIMFQENIKFRFGQHFEDVRWWKVDKRWNRYICFIEEMSKRCTFQLQMYENRVEIIVSMMCTSATVPRRFIEREKEEKIHILKVSRGNCELKAFTCSKDIASTSKGHILTTTHHSILHLFLSCYEVSIQRMAASCSISCKGGRPYRFLAT